MTPEQSQSADLIFLALCVWREARGQTDTVKLAVAYSILERVSKGRWWGTDIQSVIFHRWQYSSLTDPSDPQLTTWPLSDDPAWHASVQTAAAALGNTQINPAATADSYYDVSIPPPKWTEPPSVLIAEIGRLTFYRTE